MLRIGCPHCEAVNPIRPGDVDRAVACLMCGKRFLARADGVGVAVADEPAPAPVTEDDSDVLELEPPSRSRAAAAPAPAKAPAPAAAGKADKHEKLNSKQEEARRAMSRALADAAKLADDAVRAKGPTAAIATPRPNQPRRRGPVVVVGSGEWGRRDALLWLGGLILVVAAVIVGVVASRTRSVPEKALAAYIKPITGIEARTPLRLKRIQERAWLSGANGLLTLGEVRFDPPRSLPISAAQPVLATAIADHAYLPAYDLWAPTGAEKTVNARWKAKKTRQENIDELRRGGMELVTREELLKRLGESGIAPEAEAILAAFIVPGERAPQDEARRVAAGAAPERIDIVDFTGTHATGLVYTGKQFEYPAVPRYHGRLLRFVGDGWAAQWRVLDLTW